MNRVFKACVAPGPERHDSGEVRWLECVDRFTRYYRLSPTERQLVIATIRGKSLATCADEFRCTVGTLKTHWCRIFEKTQMRSRRDVIAGVLRYSD